MYMYMYFSYFRIVKDSIAVPHATRAEFSKIFLIN